MQFLVHVGQAVAEFLPWPAGFRGDGLGGLREKFVAIVEQVADRMHDRIRLVMVVVLERLLERCQHRADLIDRVAERRGMLVVVVVLVIIMMTMVVGVGLRLFHGRRSRSAGRAAADREADDGQADDGQGGDRRGGERKSGGSAGHEISPSGMPAG